MRRIQVTETGYCMPSYGSPVHWCRNKKWVESSDSNWKTLNKYELATKSYKVSMKLLLHQCFLSEADTMEEEWRKMVGLWYKVQACPWQTLFDLGAQKWEKWAAGRLPRQWEGNDGLKGANDWMWPLNFSQNVSCMGIYSLLLMIVVLISCFMGKPKIPYAYIWKQKLQSWPFINLIIC